MTDTLITIGITCYREGELLRECWESVLAQTDDRLVAWSRPGSTFVRKERAN